MHGVRYRRLLLTVSGLVTSQARVPGLVITDVKIVKTATNFLAPNNF